MAFPTIPTVAAGRVLVVNQADTSDTRTFPNLSSLTKNAGDRIVAIIATYQSTTNPQFSSWGGGFTEVADLGSSTTLGIGVAEKISTGSETGTFTVTQAGTITGHASMILLSIPAAHDSTAIAVSPKVDGTGAAADVASFDPGGIGTEDILWIHVAASGMDNAGGSWTGTGTTAPTNYGNRVDSNTTDSSTVGQTEIAVSFRQLNASSEDAGTAGVDVSNARNSAILIAVPPAAGAQTLSGAVYSNGPAFNAGTVSPGGVTLAGAVYTNGPSFPTGTASSNYTLTGVLFSNPPNFGSIGYLTTGPAAADHARTTQPATAWSTGTIEFITCVRNPNWYLTGFPTYANGMHRGQMAFNFRANSGAAGAMQFRYHDGTTLQTIASNAVLPGSFTSADWVWLRTVVVPSGSTVDFYYSLDPPTTAPGSVSWTAVGTQVSGAALTIRAASTTVSNVGGDSSLTGADSHSSDFTYGRLSLNGSVVWDVDFRDDDQGWDSPPATDSLGNSWSFNGVAAWSTAGTGTVVQGAAQLSGVLFSKPPAFTAGAIIQAQILAGVVLSEPLVFTAGTVSATRTLSGVLFSKPSAFTAGTITSNKTLIGVLFSKPPAFTAGTISSAATTLSGAVFSKSPVFVTGTITATRTLTGVVFNNGPTFTSGIVAPSYQIVGNLFARPPTWISGAVTSAYELTGAVFSAAPVFVAGTISTTYTVSGVLFSKPPSFIAGTITQGQVTLQGVLFSKPPSFVSGTITTGNVTLSGVLFSKTPTFAQGSVQVGGVVVDGVLFSRPPSFTAGSITTTYTLTGVVFSKSPSFIAGVITQDQTVTGVVFTEAPIFIAGTISTSYTLAGVLFSKSPAFTAGTITTTYTLSGTLFSKSPVFATGSVSAIGAITGVVFSAPPEFFTGTIISGVTVSLFPTGDGTIVDVVNELDTVVNLFASIDEDPDSPNDADWINNAVAV